MKGILSHHIGAKEVLDDHVPVFPIAGPTTPGWDCRMTDDRPEWRDQIFEAMKAADIRMVGYVPDAGHAKLIEASIADNDIDDVALTTEEEGVALAAGGWLGGKKSVLLMQSSGVGNCINMLSLRETARIPMVIIVTMRGEYAEFNPWQIPMGSKTQQAFEMCGFKVERVDRAEDAGPTVAAAMDFAYNTDTGVAVLLSQKLIGAKTW